MVEFHNFFSIKFPYDYTEKINLYILINGIEDFYLQNFILEDIPPSQTDRMFVEMSLNLLLRRLDQTSGINKY